MYMYKNQTKQKSNIYTELYAHTHTHTHTPRTYQIKQGDTGWRNVFSEQDLKVVIVAAFLMSGGGSKLTHGCVKNQFNQLKDGCVINQINQLTGVLGL